jgi:hypothetical protein
MNNSGSTIYNNVHCVTTVVQWLLYIVLSLLFNGLCTLCYHCCLMVIVHCGTTVVQWSLCIVLQLLFNGYCTLCYHCSSMVIVHCATTLVQWSLYIVLPLLFIGYCTLCYYCCPMSTKYNNHSTTVVAQCTITIEQQWQHNVQ